MAEGEQEEIEAPEIFDETSELEMHGLIGRLTQSSNTETKDLARLSSLILLYMCQQSIRTNKSYTDNDQLVLDTLGKTFKLDDRLHTLISNAIDELDRRIDVLEHKPAAESKQQPNSELETLKSELAKTNTTIEEHRQTLEELEIMRQNKFQKWIQSLEGKSK